MSEQQRRRSRDRAPLFYGLGALLGLVGVWLCDVFTVHGLSTALFLTAGDGLLWPTATRVVWWVIFWQVAIGCEMRAVWREARLEVGSKRQLWLAAHVSLVHRLLRRARHHWAAVPNARKQWARRPQPAVAVSSTPAVVSGAVQDAPATAPQAA